MLRQVVSAIALLALASTPVVARTRLFCRYTGVEITECAEQGPGNSVVQVEGCCDRQVTPALGALLNGHVREIAPPTLHLFPALAMADPPRRTSPAQREHRSESPTGPPVYMVTRALLI